jgi:hypothetical protein
VKIPLSHSLQSPRYQQSLICGRSCTASSRTGHQWSGFYVGAMGSREADLSTTAITRLIYVI